MGKEEERNLLKDRIKVGTTTFDFTHPSEGKVVKVLDNSLERTNIEILGEEKRIFDWILEGRSKSWIVRKMNILYPETKISQIEIDVLMNKNPALAKKIIKSDEALMKRHTMINLDYREKLLYVQEELEELHKMAKSEKEYSSSISAINTMLKNITLIAKLKGDIDQSSTNVNVNLGDQVAEIVAEKNSKLRSEILDNTVDITPENVMDNGTEK